MLCRTLAAGLLVVLCLGFLAVGGNSQPVPPTSPPAAEPVPAPGRTEPSLAELVTKLKNVRAQQEALNEQERKLLDQIAEKVEEQRRELQKAEQLLQQLRLSGRMPPRVLQKDDKDGFFQRDRDKGVPRNYKDSYPPDIDKGIDKGKEKPR